MLFLQYVNNEDRNCLFLLQTEGDKQIYVKVSNILVHPDFDPNTLLEDYSILTLASRILVTSTVGYACLPIGELPSFDGYPLKISGWGLTTEGGEASRVLKEATVFGLSNDQCQQAYPNDVITGSHICAAYPNTDTCQGDSGGEPLFILIFWKFIFYLIVWTIETCFLNIFIS